MNKREKKKKKQYKSSVAMLKELSSGSSSMQSDRYNMYTEAPCDVKKTSLKMLKR